MKDFRKKTQTSKMPGTIKEDGTELGVIRIHENVIASIVRKATLSVNGVIRLAGSTLVDNIAEIIGSKKIGDRAIGVDISGDSVSIDVKVILAYGTHVPTVAANIQSAVMQEIEKMTGMGVTCINVIIQELDDENIEGDN